VEKKVKIADYSKTQLQSRLNLLYAFKHSTGIMAAIFGLVGLVNIGQQSRALVCTAVGFAWLVLSAVFQSHYLACQNELQRKDNGQI